MRITILAGAQTTLRPARLWRCLGNANDRLASAGGRSLTLDGVDDSPPAERGFTRRAATAMLLVDVAVPVGRKG
jgi:hypothetical protein